MLVKQGLDDQLYDVLINNLSDGKYSAGQKIMPNDIAAEYGVSRTPVILALKRLEQEGLLVSRPGSSFVLPVLGAKDIEEICDARIMIECNAVRMFISNADQSDKKKLSDIANRCVDLSDKDDYVTYVKTDYEFHDIIVKSIGNSRVEKFFLQLQNQMMLYRYIGAKKMERMPNAAKEHVLIYEAINAGNVETAVTAVTDHIMYTKELTSKRLDTK